MDPRQNLTRTSSSNIPQGPYNPTMASAYQMPYQQHPHLPPIQSYHQALPPGNQNYMPQAQQQQAQQGQQPQQYRPELSRYQSAPAPPPSQDRYNPHATSQPPLGGLPPLPQPNSQSQPPSQQYPPSTSAGQPYQQRLAPAPPRPNNLAPLGTNYQQVDDSRGPPQMWDPNAHPQQGLQNDNGRDPTRTHVVGSQGRRGILPSAPGRAAVMPNAVNGSPKTNNAVPAKDADGKFPCPNCNKTYLHAKHLKRHMLRHTGDRPYMCVLCNDTFSRSDILKRHFQKCSVRRGNPTGASHLSNPAAHLKKSQAAAAKSTATDSPNSTTTPTTAGLANGAFTSSAMSSGPMTSTSATSFADAPQMPYGMPNGPPNDMQRPQAGQPAPHNGDANSNQSWAMQNPRTNQMMYHSAPATANQFAMPHGNVDDKRHGIPGAPQHMSGEEWNMFHAAGQENYMNPMFAGYEQGHHEVKNEHPEGAANGYYIPSTSLGADGTLRPPLWHLDESFEDPLQLKADQLVDFLFPGGLQESLEHQQNNFHVRACLTPESIKLCLESFNNFQGHWPFLHLPTFSITDINYDGILLVIICIGAVYSDHLTKSQVRDLMVRTKQGIERTSSILKNMGSQKETLALGVEFAEFQALLWLQTLFVWHGGPLDRAEARTELQRIFALARQHNLLTLFDPTDTISYSYLHSLPLGQTPDPSKFVWRAWVEQEKRVRTMYTCYLLSCALNIYFNIPASFEVAEIRLPLPCDDAAWEAPDEESCAQALGLRGPAMQRIWNKTGSLQMNQMSFADAVQMLHDTDIPLQPLSTNVYSKFILVHALHTEIWRVQKQQSLEKSAAYVPSDRSTTPQTALYFKSIATALERWKASWDDDMILQYPVIPGKPSRRFGFCRDAVHFYFLGRAFMQPNRINDWQLTADTRFYQSLRGLSQAVNWARNDVLSRGEEPGSGFDFDIGDYGLGTLELNMRKLFPPLDTSRYK